MQLVSLNLKAFFVSVVFSLFQGVCTLVCVLFFPLSYFIIFYASTVKRFSVACRASLNLLMLPSWVFCLQVFLYINITSFPLSGPVVGLICQRRKRIIYSYLSRCVSSPLPAVIRRNGVEVMREGGRPRPNSSLPGSLWHNGWSWWQHHTHQRHSLCPKASALKKFLFELYTVNQIKLYVGSFKAADLIIWSWKILLYTVSSELKCLNRWHGPKLRHSKALWNTNCRWRDGARVPLWRCQVSHVCLSVWSVLLSL